MLDGLLDCLQPCLPQAVLDFFPKARIPLDWQRVKEHAWANPSMLVAFLTTATSLLLSVICAFMLLTGNEIAGFIFRSVLIVVAMVAESAGFLKRDAWRLVGTAVAGPALGNSPANGVLGLPGERSLVRHPFELCGLSFLCSALPTCVVSVAYYLQLVGELGRLRLHTVFRWAYIAMAWSFLGSFLLLRLCWQWESGLCKLVEAEGDVPCQRGLQQRVGPLFGQLAGMVCSMETGTECEMMRLALYVHTALAAASLKSVALCTHSLGQAWRALDAKWALHRHGKPTCEGIAEGEHQCLLR